MGSQRHRQRRAPVRRLLLALVAAALAASLPWVIGAGGSAHASTTAPAASYAALAGEAPSGLPLVESHRARTSADPLGPTWPAQPPQGAAERWPLASTIRRVDPGVAGLSVWIARGVAGGICVLLYDGAPVEGVSAVDSDCSGPEGYARGASLEVLEIPGRPGQVIAAGVVPDGVGAVSTALADGSTQTTPVRDNAWARVGTVPAAAGAEPIPITGG